MAIGTTAAILGGTMLAGSIGGAALSASASKKAAKSQQKAAEAASDTSLQAQRESIAAQREMFDLTRSDLAPYRDAGTFALGELRDYMGDHGLLRQQFDFTLADFEADPGYQFRLQEGMKAIERSGAAR
ncbi:MAG: hypothetical protein R3212_13850, partial [Xanthomonadales bacterium]|nr:hypothetical protein [Xanthomonadales bacterium]